MPKERELKKLIWFMMKSLLTVYCFYFRKTLWRLVYNLRALFSLVSCCLFIERDLLSGVPRGGDLSSDLDFIFLLSFEGLKRHLDESKWSKLSDQRGRVLYPQITEKSRLLSKKNISNWLLNILIKSKRLSVIPVTLKFNVCFCMLRLH
jgi:hypothetical protein